MSFIITLKLQIGSFSIEVTGPREYAEQKFGELVKEYSPNSNSSSSIGKNDNPENFLPSSVIKNPVKSLAPNEFIRMVNPKSQVDRALSLAYYLEKYSGSDSFTTAELSDVCLKAKQPSFTNVSDSVGQLVTKGLVMSTGDKDGKRAYTLTTMGETQLETMLSPK